MPQLEQSGSSQFQEVHRAGFPEEAEDQYRGCDWVQTPTFSNLIHPKMAQLELYLEKIKISSTLTPVRMSPLPQLLGRQLTSGHTYSSLSKEKILLKAENNYDYNLHRRRRAEKPT